MFCTISLISIKVLIYVFVPFFSFYRSPSCTSSGLCYLSVLLLALLASVMANGKLDLFEKNCVSITVKLVSEFCLGRLISKATQGVVGRGHGQWGFPCGPVKGRHIGKSKNFVPVVLTLQNAFGSTKCARKFFSTYEWIGPRDIKPKEFLGQLCCKYLDIYIYYHYKLYY